MVVRSKIFMGLQRRGNTKIDSTIKIEKTGAMEITVRKGIYTDPLGVKYELPSDKVISLTPGTKLFVILIHNPDTGETDIWHTTSRGIDLNLPPGFKFLERLIGWGWFIIPPDATDIANIPLYTMTWIDNVGMRYKRMRDPETFQIVDKLKFYGKGEETGKEYEFDELEHFVADLPGTYFYCPNEGAVTRGRPCKVCGNMDVVRIKVKGY